MTYLTQQIEGVEDLSALKLADGKCDKDIRSRIIIAKKIIFELVPIWNGR